MEAIELAERVKQALENKKGEDVVTLDMREVSSVTDFFVIGSGNSAPQLKALSDEVSRLLKEEGERPHRKAGDANSGWLILDYLNVVVHILTPDIRKYYALEELWKDAGRV